jgi:hypothetical protein
MKMHRYACRRLGVIVFMSAPTTMIPPNSIQCHHTNTEGETTLMTLQYEGMAWEA